MSLTADGDSRERRFAELLATYDEGLATGTSPSSDGSPVPAEIAAELQEARACLRLIEQLLPRTGADQPDASAAVAPTPDPFVDGTRHIGRFRIVRRLGAGGGGVVFLAEDPHLGRPIALKVPRPEALADPVTRRRFVREGMTAAGLDHPNIVPVYEAGEVGPVCYIASAYCEGPTLAEWLDRRDHADPPRATAALVATVAEAVHHAHCRGVLHRDIKPSNVLLVPRPDAPAAERLLDRDFTPRLTDFGLARTIAGPGGETRTGAALGTPQYMAPEQAEGQSGLFGPPTDVHALGVLLYELLTDRPPFRGDSDLGTLQQVVSETPLPPHCLRRTIPRDLEVICLKCLEKEPWRRYASAEELAQDLRRFLAGEPIRARPIGAAGRLRRWCRRKPVPAALSAVVAVLLIALVVGSTAASVHFGRLADRERGLRAAEYQARKALEAKLYFHRIALAQHELHVNNPEGLAEQLAACPADRRAWEWYYLRRLTPPPSLTLSGHTGTVSAVAFSPDGRLVASAGETDGTVRVWDAATGRAFHTPHGHAGGVRSIAFRPDGRILASADDATIRFWEPETGRPTGILTGQTGTILRLAYAPDGEHLASVGMDRTIRLWDPTSGRQVLTLAGHRDVVTCVAFSPDGAQMASGDEAGEVWLWDARSGNHVRTLLGHYRRIHGVAFHPDGQRLVSAGEDQVVRLWDLTTGRPLRADRGHAGLITDLAVSADGRQLASSSEDGSVKVWDPANGRALLTLTGHTNAVRGVAFSPDGTRVASGSLDSTVRLWDITQGRGTLVFRGGHTKAITEVAVSPDGRWVASASRDGSVRIWDAATARERLVLRGHSDVVHGVAFSPDGTRLVTAGGDQTVRVWGLSDGHEVLALKGNVLAALRVAFSPDGRSIASAGDDATVRVWDARCGRELLTLGGRAPVQAVAFSSDSTRLAAAGNEGVVRIWDVASGREVLRLMGHSGTIHDVAYSADGRRLASAGYDRTVRVWDAATGQLERKFVGHTGFATGVAFSPDGTRLASIGWDGAVRVWDAATGQQTIALNCGEGRLRGVAFSPDGHKLVAGSSDSNLLLWDASPCDVR